MDEWIIYKLSYYDEKCARLHGYSWKARIIYVRSNELITDGTRQGMIMDYGDIKTYIKPILDEYLDHHYLNQSLALDNPTYEEIAKWLFEQLEKVNMPLLYAV